MSAGQPSLGGDLVEVCLYGRGGQGTVIASTMLAKAAMIEGRSVQAFPEFGVERRGAPVTAFLRIASGPIRLRCKVYAPDHVLVLDRQLVPLVDLSGGRVGWFVANTPLAPAALELSAGCRVATVDATRIARARGLGTGAVPVVNAPMAAAFARVTGLVGIDSLIQAIRETVPAATDANVEAAREAWTTVEVAPAWEEQAMQRAWGA